MRKKSPIHNVVDRVNKNTTGIFKRDSELIVTLPATIASVVKSNRIYLSEFVIAKVKGKIVGLNSHPEITDRLLCKIPSNLSNPMEILEDTRLGNKYLFININPLNEIVVEVSRYDSGKTEINTIHLINKNELKRLEQKFPVIYSSGETPGFSHTCVP